MTYVILLVVAILFLVYVSFKPNKSENKPVVLESPKLEYQVNTTHQPETNIEYNPDLEEPFDNDKRILNSYLKKEGFERTKNYASDNIVENHNKYIKETKTFSSGASTGAISSDNRTEAQTNYVGFFRPERVPIHTPGGGKQVPDIPIESMERARKKNPFRYNPTPYV